MIEVTEKQFQEDLTKYTTRVQNGEDFLVEREDGTKYIATDVTKFENQQEIIMSIRKHIEAADDALRLAIIEALENKRDEQLETMFEALGKIRELILTTPIRSVDNVVSFYKNKAEYDFNLDSVDPYEDYGYKLSDDLLDFTDKPTKPGKDMDNLDGPA